MAARQTEGSLSRRFFYGALLISILPLMLVTGLYDRMYLRAVDSVAREQALTKLAAAENRMIVFLQEREQELRSLVDLSEPLANLPALREVEDLARFLADGPAIYGVVRFRDGAQDWLASERLRSGVDLTALPVSSVGETEILGPVLPDKWRPGWFILRMAGAERGFGLVLRLTSFTELAGDLSLPGVQRPLIRTPQGAYVDELGVPVRAPLPGNDKNLEGAPFLPGWQILLQWQGDPLLAPLGRQRLLLFVVVVVAALCAALVARNLSRRLQRQLAPLVDAAERVAAGDFDTPLSIDAEGEIHYLALAQERMRLRLKRLVASAITVERRAVLGQFAAGVAHEIRNPLATIKATVQALARKEQSDDRRALMEMVSGEIDRASDVVQLMLDYANPPEVKPIEVDLQEVVETVRILTDATARAGDVTLRQAPGEPVRVMADPAQLRQILINLVMNAVEAMEGMGGTVDLVVRRRGLNAYVIVRDNGPGVTQQHLPYLAEPFFTTKMRGTGLGLAICTQLAQANEGKLVFRGASGKGLVAILQLPLLTNDDSERLHGNSIRSYN